jgi:hypothetical protein
VERIDRTLREDFWAFYGDNLEEMRAALRGCFKEMGP